VFIFVFLILHAEMAIFTTNSVYLACLFVRLMHVITD